MEIWPKANAAERIKSVHSFFTSVLPDVSLRDSVHQIVIHLVSVRLISFQTLFTIPESHRDWDFAPAIGF